MAQDRFEAFVAACAQCERTLARGLQPRFAVLFAQAQDAQATHCATMCSFYYLRRTYS
ncbi:hypothetical protein KPSA1_03864 [Pseudomonas syringae pv. actinidiae]|uniref:Uncharacterized protein n=1 Tax=Pseudomonas syringae pv. actinidiae TaxID=103796 RepID=A0A2V0QBJ8_PSESF|nr:hypothetical protein KPSA1_03864 [Pseudomonas syringae pv. actinidiae]